MHCSEGRAEISSFIINHGKIERKKTTNAKVDDEIPNHILDNDNIPDILFESIPFESFLDQEYLPLEYSEIDEKRYNSNTSAFNNLSSLSIAPNLTPLFTNKRTQAPFPPSSSSPVNHPPSPSNASQTPGPLQFSPIISPPSPLPLCQSLEYDDILPLSSTVHSNNIEPISHNEVIVNVKDLIRTNSPTQYILSQNRRTPTPQNHRDSPIMQQSFIISNGQLYLQKKSEQILLE